MEKNVSEKSFCSASTLTAFLRMWAVGFPMERKAVNLQMRPPKNEDFSTL